MEPKTKTESEIEKIVLSVIDDVCDPRKTILRRNELIKIFQLLNEQRQQYYNDWCAACQEIGGLKHKIGCLERENKIIRSENLCISHQMTKKMCYN